MRWWKRFSLIQLENSLNRCRAGSAMALNKKDGFKLTETDRRGGASAYTQMKGQFLIDRKGVVRWPNSSAAKRAFRHGKVPDAR